MDLADEEALSSPENDLSPAPLILPNAAAVASLHAAQTGPLELGRAAANEASNTVMLPAIAGIKPLPHVLEGICPFAALTSVHLTTQTSSYGRSPLGEPFPSLPVVKHAMTTSRQAASTQRSIPQVIVNARRPRSIPSFSTLGAAAQT